MNNIKRNVIIANLFLLFTVFAWMLYDKEELLKEGEILVLRLQPADPRSFMMGDYMTLNYEVNSQIPQKSLDLTYLDLGTFDGPTRSRVVVKMQDSVAVFVRMHRNEPLGKGEFELPARRTYFNYEILPNEYLFQEGRSKHFNQAEYAQFRVNKSGDVVIECLLDKNRNPLR